VLLRSYAQLVGRAGSFIGIIRTALPCLGADGWTHLSYQLDNKARHVPGSE
jgi:hypothetical protein